MQQIKSSGKKCKVIKVVYAKFYAKNEQHIKDMAVQQTNQILILSSVSIQQYYMAFW